MERPRRRIWQIQLPTAIALMVAAAFLIHLNTACKGVESGDYSGCATMRQHVEEFGYGFPSFAYSSTLSQPKPWYGSFAERLQYIEQVGNWEWHDDAVVFDALVACSLLIFVAYASEKMLPPPNLARDWPKVRRETRWSKRGGVAGGTPAPQFGCRRDARTTIRLQAGRLHHNSYRRHPAGESYKLSTTNRLAG